MRKNKTQYKNDLEPSLNLKFQYLMEQNALKRVADIISYEDFMSVFFYETYMLTFLYFDKYITFFNTGKYFEFWVDGEEAKTYLRNDDLKFILDNARIDGKSVKEIWDDLYLS